MGSLPRRQLEIIPRSTSNMLKFTAAQQLRKPMPLDVLWAFVHCAQAAQKNLTASCARPTVTAAQALRNDARGASLHVGGSLPRRQLRNRVPPRAKNGMFTAAQAVRK